MTPLAAENGRIKAAILGAGNLGGDLACRLLEQPEHLELALVADLDPVAAGLTKAHERGAATSDKGIDAIVAQPEITVVFDATSAKAHAQHARVLSEAGKVVIDLTSAGAGPYVVPVVNLDEHLQEVEVSLATCPAQAAIPIVHAVSTATPVTYAEVVSTLASRSLGPAMRRGVDEFTSTTARALEQCGGAERGKAILVVSPADPPTAMRNAVYVVTEDALDRDAASGAVERVVAGMQRHVPGYRLSGQPAYDERDTPWGVRPTLAVTVEVEGAGRRLPPYAGNLDVTTAAARAVAEAVARQLTRTQRLAA